MIVNLFGGPGTGKSTGAAYIFSKLKMLGIDAELVSEFAKDKVWEENKAVFQNQFYIIGKQSFKISRCYGKVDVIVTDSPLINNCLYINESEPYCEDLKNSVIKLNSKYNNLNIFLKRVKKYNPNGRFQTEEEAKQIDKNTLDLFEKYCISYIGFNGDKEGYDSIVDYIMGTFITKGEK